MPALPRPIGPSLPRVAGLTRAFALAFALVPGALGPRALAAQRPMDAPYDWRAADDSTRFRQGLTRSALVGGTVSGTFLNPGTSLVGASATTGTFLTEHVQVGVGGAYSESRSTGIVTDRQYQGQVGANYVFGGGPRWRGYAGGYVGASNGTSVAARSVGGAQVGALYFVEPELAINAAYTYGGRVGDSGHPLGQFSVQLQPLFFGRVDGSQPEPAGFGMSDVALSIVYYQRSGVTGSANGLIAPYLTRWLQVGAQAQLYRAAIGNAGALDVGPTIPVSTATDVTGLARAYLPLSVGTQPFAGGFVTRSSLRSPDVYGGGHSGVTTYGPVAGVRHFVSARSAIDVAIERRFSGPLSVSGSTVNGTVSTTTPRPAPHTLFSVGLVTRIGRARGEA